MSSKEDFDHGQFSSEDRLHRLRNYIREYRPLVAKLINEANNRNKRKFSESDIDDVLQESIIVYYEKITDATFQLTSKESTFIYGIVKNKINERIRKINKVTIVSSDSGIGELQESDYDLTKDVQMEKGFIFLKECIEQLSETKKRVFELFYYHNHSLKVIAEITGLANEGSATTQKFRAFKQIEGCVKSKY
jgi:RNA polymerase sigma factor (sigma-70 family)